MTTNASLLFIDPVSGNRFRIEQAKGLPQGELALIFVSSPKFGHCLPKDEWLCHYSEQVQVLTVKQWEERQMQQPDCPLHAYAFQGRKDMIVLPVTKTPHACNLGLFANAALSTDPHRLRSNARLTASFASHWPQGIRVSLRSVKTLYSGDEVLISYGPQYTKRLKRLIASSNTHDTMAAQTD